jgi:hypothetical protein
MSNMKKLLFFAFVLVASANAYSQTPGTPTGPGGGSIDVSIPANPDPDPPVFPNEPCSYCVENNTDCILEIKLHYNSRRYSCEMSDIFIWPAPQPIALTLAPGDRKCFDVSPRLWVEDPGPVVVLPGNPDCYYCIDGDYHYTVHIPGGDGGCQISPGGDTGWLEGCGNGNIMGIYNAHTKTLVLSNFRIMPE